MVLENIFICLNEFVEHQLQKIQDICPHIMQHVALIAQRVFLYSFQTRLVEIEICNW
jgi:hypothetical protein